MAAGNIEHVKTMTLDGSRIIRSHRGKEIIEQPAVDEKNIPPCRVTRETIGVLLDVSC